MNNKNEPNNILLGKPSSNPSEKYKNYSRRTETVAKHQKLDKATESDKIKMFDRDFVNTCVKARNDLNKKRSDLARELNISDKVLTEFETYKMAYSGAFKVRISKILQL